IRKFRNVLFKQAAEWDEALNVIPNEKKSFFRDNIKEQSLLLHNSLASEIDGAEKLINSELSGSLQLLGSDQ
mgnify:CR=1